MSNKSLSNSLICALSSNISEKEKLEILSELKDFSFSNTATYNKLEHLILNNNNNELRYQLLKLIYKFYPRTGKKLISWSLLNDPNYNIKIINLIESNLNNFNPLIEEALQKKYNRERLVNDIIDNEFLRFMLFWKDFSNQFTFFYDILLRCFILREKNHENLIFLCRKITDPFQAIISIRTYDIMDFFKLTGVKTQKTFYLKLSTSNEKLKPGPHKQISLEKLRRNLSLYQRATKLPQSKVKFSILNEECASLPSIRLFSDFHNFVLYFS